MKWKTIHPIPSPIPGPIAPLERPLEIEWSADLVAISFDHSLEIHFSAKSQIPEPEEIAFHFQLVNKPLEINLNPIR